MKKKRLILRAREWHVGYYTGTVEEICAVLGNLGIEVTEIVDIEPIEDLGVTYNRSILTKMKVIGHDVNAQRAFLAEFEKLVGKYSIGKNKELRFVHGDVQYFFDGRPIEVNDIDVLIADNTTFRSSYFDKERNRQVCILSQREFEPCSKVNEKDIWDFLWEHFSYLRP